MDVILVKNNKSESFEKKGFSGPLEISLTVASNIIEASIGVTDFSVPFVMPTTHGLWLTTFQDPADSSMTYSIKSPDMQKLISFASWKRTKNNWMGIKGLENITYKDDLLPNNQIQWFQLPPHKNFVDDNGQLKAPSKEAELLNTNLSGYIHFELGLEENEAIVVHGGSKEYFAHYPPPMKKYQTSFDSMASSLKIR